MIENDSASQARRVLFSRTGVRYEVAADVIGAIISHFAHEAGVEHDKPAPDALKIAQAQRIVAELKDIRDGLNPSDPAGIEGVIQRLAPLARHLYLDPQQGTQEARRAAQFDQANASLRLEGFAASIDDLAVQAQIIRGELTHDQAVAWYSRSAQR